MILTRYEVVSDQISCKLEGEVVVLSLTQGIYYGLDHVGTRIWSLLQQPRSLEELRDILLQEFNVESEVCEKQLRSFADRLVAAGLIQIQA